MPDSALEALWYQPRPPVALRALARGFGLLVRLRRASYARGILQQHRVGRPVIVVGNITVGGTGKTPLVIWLCEQLRQGGFAPGIVLRGHGGERVYRSQPRLVTASSDVAAVGDEAVLLAARTGAPVVVCRDRVLAARRVLAEGADVVVADDGLQHLALARDVELAVVDASRALGNGRLLPAGPLREPAERLERVDAVVLNVDGAERVVARAERLSAAAGANTTAAANLAASTAAAIGGAFTMRLAGERLLPLGGGGAALTLISLTGRRVHALAGIGNPERFFGRLAAAGLDVIAHRFPDHHRYRASELEFGDGLPLLMTEKDAVKCRRFGAPADAERWYLPVEATFSESDAARLMTRIHSRMTLPRAP